MTEYDYSPEAYERYLATQNRIARWVDGTHQQSPRNPFTPATPHVLAMKELQDEERRSSKHRHRHRDRDRTREMDYQVPSPTRHRSSSHSAVPPRPTPTRSQTAPPPRDNDYYQPANPSPTKHSRHSSSRSSSTTRPHSASTTTHFPQNHIPHIAHPQPRRSNTSPVFYNNNNPAAAPTTAYAHRDKHPPVVVPLQNGGYVMGPPVNSRSRGGSMDLGVSLQNAPQLPYSAYQTVSPTKQLPLLKRLFTGLTGGNRHSTHKSRRKRRSSF